MKPNVMSKLVIFIASIWCVGCAQLSPQRINFTVDVADEKLFEGTGKTSLTVVDDRSNQVIGKRGGAYDTATIESKEPLVNVVEKIATKEISDAGLEISTAFPDYDFTIRIQEFSYTTESRKASIKRTTARLVLKVDVRKGNQSFSNAYSRSQYVDTLGYPRDKKNSELLEGIFQSVLNRLFTDPDLDRFIE